jgi:hypothetical protein
MTSAKIAALILAAIVLILLVLGVISALRTSAPVYAV